MLGVESQIEQLRGNIKFEFRKGSVNKPMHTPFRPYAISSKISMHRFMYLYLPLGT